MKIQGDFLDNPLSQIRIAYIVHSERNGITVFALYLLQPAFHRKPAVANNDAFEQRSECLAHIFDLLLGRDVQIYTLSTVFLLL